MNIWFTSDTHFGHTNIAGPKLSVWKDGFRNFNSVQEINEILQIMEKIPVNFNDHHDENTNV